MAGSAKSTTQVLPMYPMLVPGYVVIPMDAGDLNLRRGRRSLVLRGRTAASAQRILDYLDGTHSLDELATLTHLDRTTLDNIVRRLGAAQLITDREVTLPRDDPRAELATALEVFAASEGNQGHAAYWMVQRQRVALVGHKEVACNIGQILTDSGVGTVEWLASETQADVIRKMRPTFLIQASPTAAYRSCLAINSLALELSFPWLAAWIEGPNLIVTHVVVPDETACFECLLTRQRRNFPHYDADLAYERYQREHAGTEASDAQAVPPFGTHLLAGLAASRTLGHMVGLVPGPPVPFLLEFSLQLLESVTHPVLRLPRCPACGASSVRQGSAPFALGVEPQARQRILVGR